MPASFVDSAGGIFGTGGGAQGLVTIPAVDDIVSSKGNLAIYDSVSIQINDTIQFFLTFDDVVKYVFFGKGIGSVVVEGTMYSMCAGGGIPGLKACASAVGDLRGQKVDVSLGEFAVSAIFTSAQVSVISEPDIMGRFVFNLAAIDHHM
jgi:hypothetical protein